MENFNIFTNEYFVIQLQKYLEYFKNQDLLSKIYSPSDDGVDLIKSGIIKLQSVPAIVKPMGLLDMQHSMTRLDINTLALSENGRIWMSVTPMEVQSMAVPLKLAAKHNNVGVGGLGLGYYPLMLSEMNPSVKIRVYEINKDLIDFVTNIIDFPDNIEIIHTDVLNINCNRFDFFFMDIYLHIGDPDMFSHYMRMTSHNEIGYDNYYAWSQEIHLLPYIQVHNELPLIMDGIDISRAKNDLKGYWRMLKHSILHYEYVQEYSEMAQLFISVDTSLIARANIWERIL